MRELTLNSRVSRPGRNENNPEFQAEAELLSIMIDGRCDFNDIFSRVRADDFMHGTGNHHRLIFCGIRGMHRAGKQIDYRAVHAHIDGFEGIHQRIDEILSVAAGIEPVFLAATILRVRANGARRKATAPVRGDY